MKLAFGVSQDVVQCTLFVGFDDLGVVISCPKRVPGRDCLTGYERGRMWNNWVIRSPFIEPIIEHGRRCLRHNKMKSAMSIKAKKITSFFDFNPTSCRKSNTIVNDIVKTCALRHTPMAVTSHKQRWWSRKRPKKAKESKREKKRKKNEGELFFFPSLHLCLSFVTRKAARHSAAWRGVLRSSRRGRYVGRSVSSCSASVSFRAASRAQLASIFDSNTLKQYP